MARIVLRGRSEEMATALSMLRRVRRFGCGGVLLLNGEPGIGKSALFAAIVEQAASAHFSCAVSKADQISRISPAAPLILALRSGTRPRRRHPDQRRPPLRSAEPRLGTQASSTR